MWRALPLVVLLVAAAPASAATLVSESGGRMPAPYQRWVDESHVPTPPGRVTLHLGICPGAPDWAVGCAIASQQAIYLDRSGGTRRALMHEMGHLFDFDTMSDPMRDAFRQVLRRRGAWAGAAANNPLQEKFAEAYSLCSRRRKLAGVYFALYLYTPTPAQHRRACRVIRRAAATPSHAPAANVPPVVYMAAPGCLGVWRYVDRAARQTRRYFACLASLIRMSAWSYVPGASHRDVCGG